MTKKAAKDGTRDEKQNASMDGCKFLPITLLKKKALLLFGAIWLIFPMTRKAEFKSHNSQLIYMIFLNGTKCKRNGS